MYICGKCGKEITEGVRFHIYYRNLREYSDEWFMSTYTKLALCSECHEKFKEILKEYGWPREKI